MILLSAYGDALGAAQENRKEIIENDFPKSLSVRPMPRMGHPWGTWLPENICRELAGVPTDDTCFKLFILIPWLNSLQGEMPPQPDRAFHDFISSLAATETDPNWLRSPRDNQILQWGEMQDSRQRGEAIHFYAPGKAVAFGLFQYLDLAAFYGGATPLEVFHTFHQISALDEDHAGMATGFLAALLHAALHHDGSGDFASWYFDTAFTLLKAIHDRMGKVVPRHHRDLLRLLDLMTQAGEKRRDQSESAFAKWFQVEIVEAACPPYMNHSFSGIHDPLRLLGLMTAAIAFARNRPARALRCVARSTGDTDTGAALLGTLLGAWHGHERLSGLAEEPELKEGMEQVETVLRDYFKVDANEVVSAYMAFLPQTTPE